MSSIYSKIEEKGNVEAKEIIEAGTVKAEALKKSIKEGYDKEYKKIIDDATRSNADYLKTNITQIEQLAKQKALYEKKAIINKVIEKVQEKLLKISDKELTDLVVKTIAADTIQGDETVKVSKEDYSKYQKLFASEKEGDKVVLDVLNKKLGAKYKLTLSKEPAPIKGGFVLVGKSYDVDHSYKVLLDDLREKYESELADVLFGSGE